MKFKTVIGILLILSGVSIFSAVKILDYSMQRGMNKALEGSVITASVPESESNISENSSNELEWSIEALEENQSIVNVSTYSSVLEIPKFGILVYIYPDLSEESLQRGVGHYKNTRDLGELGNCAIAGHSSDTFSCILNDVKDLEILDIFYVYDKKGVRHTYYVTDKYVVNPTDIQILNTYDESISQFTMVTCTNRGTQRLIVEGKEFDEEGLAKFKSTFEDAKIKSMIAMNGDMEVNNIIKFVKSRGIISSIYIRTPKYYTLKYFEQSYPYNLVLKEGGVVDDISED